MLNQQFKEINIMFFPNQQNIFLGFTEYISHSNFLENLKIDFINNEFLKLDVEIENYGLDEIVYYENNKKNIFSIKC